MWSTASADLVSCTTAKGENKAHTVLMVHRESLAAEQSEQGWHGSA